MDTEADAADLARAIEGERALLDPAVRSSPERFVPLLDPEFTEVGASGRRYTYAETVAELSRRAGSDGTGPRYRASRIEGTVLAPGVVHLTYETVLDGRRARRSSLWRRIEPGGPLRMYWHQGTPVPPGTD